MDTFLVKVSLFLFFGLVTAFAFEEQCVVLDREAEFVWIDAREIGPDG